MAKQLIGNGNNSYTFDASAKTVTFSGITLLPHQILLINNVSRETIIYNPFSSGKGFTAFSNGVLTLEFDTTTYDDADVLQIFYDNSDDVQVLLADMSVELKNLYSVIANPPWHDQKGGLIIGSGTIGTVTTITTVTTVSNVSQLGGRAVPDALTNPLLETGFILIRDRFS
ncbi:MAG TPA: hypothetical protein PKL15_08775 [Saprospiraceae bacterium]|nr:hypothetical protein [Saprospiraceae bacterium]